MNGRIDAEAAVDQSEQEQDRGCATMVLKKSADRKQQQTLASLPGCALSGLHVTIFASRLCRGLFAFVLVQVSETYSMFASTDDR